VTYNEVIDNELKTYTDNCSIHDLSAAANYYNEKYLKKKLEKSIGVASFRELAIKYINIIKQAKPENEINILSLGSGNCDIEVNLVTECNFQGKLFCYELNPKMLERGKQNAIEKGLNNFEFIECDINNIKIEQKFDIILAFYSLHHFLRLEHIFTEINMCMTEKSFFIIEDMIGRNGHMFYGDTYQICTAIWNILPKELKYNHFRKKFYKTRNRPDFWGESFEGVRAQDILPLLDETFTFKDFAPFCTIANKFTDRDFGHNYNLNNELHRSVLDLICNYDIYLSENNLLRPTQLIATMMKKNTEAIDYKYLDFENPKKIYMQSGKKIFRYFDYSILFLIDNQRWEMVKPIRNFLKKIMWNVIGKLKFQKWRTSFNKR